MGRIVRGVLLILVAAASAWAQDAAAVEQQVEKLRAQLREVADKEAQLQESARQLDEDLRPENVERSLASVGTTDARALREQRREQLERQKAGVEGQLASLSTSRSRLEAAIAAAEAEAVRLRAAALGAANAPAPASPSEPVIAASPPPTPAVRKRPRTPRTSKRVRRSRPRRRATPR